MSRAIIRKSIQLKLQLPIFIRYSARGFISGSNDFIYSGILYDIPTNMLRPVLATFDFSGIVGSLTERFNIRDDMCNTLGIDPNILSRNINHIQENILREINKYRHGKGHLTMLIS